MTGRVIMLASPALLAVLAAGGVVHAQALSGTALVNALTHGGYVLVMRHASSPAQVPDAQTADRENTTRERQLDRTGRDTSIAMGKAVKALGIPVGEVYTSPTYRARETARLAQFTNPVPVPELGDHGRSMKAVGAPDAKWLQQRAARASRGTNILVITHQPNITAAFPGISPVPGDGEMLVFQPDGKGGASLVGRIRIEEWPTLATSRAR
jgi:phosphohistidine phosphatase SixA